MLSGKGKTMESNLIKAVLNGNFEADSDYIKLYRSHQPSIIAMLGEEIDDTGACESDVIRRFGGASDSLNSTMAALGRFAVCSVRSTVG